MDLHKNKIFEDGYDQKKDVKDIRREIMTEEQIRRVDVYIEKYDELKGEVQQEEQEWIEIQDAMKCERWDNSDRTQSFVNVLVPNIEGQLATLTQRKVKSSIRGKGLSDESFARTLEPVADAICRENKIRRKLKTIGRRYIAYGNTFATVGWNKDLLTQGMPEINTPLMTNVLIDGKIKNYDDLNRSDFVIEEVGSMSIMWARRKYGDKIADALELGHKLDMGAKSTNDDAQSFTYLKVWTKNNEYNNLQLVEISSSGILMKESDPSKPYYTHVNNKYPVFAIDLYPVEGEIYGFGDGKLLLPIQNLINRLYDEIILAIKFSSQGRTYADINSRLNPNEFAENDPSMPLFVKNPGQYIKTTQGVGINQVVFNLLEQIFQKVQEVTRFSSLMIGQSPEQSMTATQSSIQMQQGNTGMTDKQTDLSRMLSDVMEYALGLCVQFWNAEQAFRIANADDDTKREYAWVNPKKLRNVPVKIPATQEYIRSQKNKNPKGKTPKHMILTDDKGNEVTKNIELDVEVSIGEGMPRNKMSLYNMVLQLSQLQILDETTGQPRSLFTYDQVKDLMEDIIGIKIKESDKGTMAVMPNGQQQPLNMSANLEGSNIQGMAKPSRSVNNE